MGDIGAVDTVLTVADQPGRVADSVKHRHIPLSYSLMPEDAAFSVCMNAATTWVLDQIYGQRTVLIRSERGRQRPALIAGLAILRMGGWFHDANTLIKQADSRALTDFRYLNALKAEDELLRLRSGRP